MPSATLITNVPNFVSREEHTTIAAETPVSFTDIPPVLRHKEDNVSATLDPPLHGFSAEDGAQGTLYIIESVLVFMSSTGRGFQIEYPTITLHAVSRAEAGPSIYCQLDEHAGEVEGAASNDEMDDMRELSIVPQSAASLEPIFEALSRCAALHPDKATPSDDEEMDAFIDADSGGFEVFTGDEDQELSEVGRAALAHLESIIYYPDDQSEVNGAVNGDVNGGENASDEENVERTTPP
ncbi:regulator of volume decrease after cellular swelling-domain-containing protein [Mycena maculata]|uniref:Regulator of volume decrease after cellular swelling-domain-containing protein n=1 Tax=Mycena maculata TaxID=230809 RepID=A0AAD7HJ13_9AGAR|nr:regulator of volume decrease after cellular swelling-domain-containing protein [Mycena maculata]